MADGDVGRKNFKIFAMSAWNTMPAEVKEAWAQVDTEDMKASAKKRSNAVSSDTDEGKKSMKTSSSEKKSSSSSNKKMRLKKDPNAPKRPLSAYMFFTIEERANLPNDMTPQMKTSELGKRWKDLEQADKTKFEEMAVKDRDRYSREKKEWEDKGNKVLD